ncbi:MAG: Na/Pi cotransporter family protein, partial [Planctomycetaceae bacterium]|nr:Na/Pi cotransporter family protein [Planctomycetaceae bacterium]
FLFGMDQMTSTLRLAAGERMRSVLAKLTSNRFAGVLAGTFVTSVIQSSSVTTVLVVGFVSAGLMTLQQSIGVILGAEIGTTITAQIIAFKITKAALGIVALGFAIQFLARQERLQQYGTMILGFGLLFFGMNVMADATEPLRDAEPFIQSIHQLNRPLTGILLAAAFTAIVQSSSATTVLVIVLASEGVLELEQAVPLILGANIGTCITALLASIGKPREAVRAAFVHATFNILGVTLWFSFIDQLAALARLLSSDLGRQIAHTHTIFNVTNTCIFIWLTTPLARFVTFLIPDRSRAFTETTVSRHLDPILLQTPPLALATVRMELQRLGISALHMVRESLPTVLHGSQRDLDQLQSLDDDVDALHAAILTYLARLSRENLSKCDSRRLHDFLLMANYLENMGDMIESSLVTAGRHRLRDGLVISGDTEVILMEVHHEVCQTVAQSVRAIATADSAIAQNVLKAKQEISHLVGRAEDHLSRRLIASEPHRLAAYRLESEIMEHLKRIYYFAKRIARLVIDEESDGNCKSPDSASAHDPQPA